MKNLVALPNISSYYDRLLMFCELEELLEQSYIYIRKKNNDLTPVKKKYPNVKFTVYSGKDSFLSKVNGLKSFLQNNSDTGPVIAHDLIEPYMLIINRFFHYFKSKKNIKHIVSLYFPNTKFFKEKGWLNISQSVSSKERYFYNKLFFKRMLMDKAAAKFADGIIANSSEICNSLHKYYNYPKERLAVIPTAIDTSRYSPVKNAKEKLPEPLCRAEQLLLYTGSIQPRKEIKVIIEALGHLHKFHAIKPYLVLCGDIHVGDISSYLLLAGYYNIKEYIHFVGQVPFEVLRDYYSSADCLVFPSRWEGSPRVVKEAMACGCPVVAADIPGNRIIDDGNNVITFMGKHEPEHLAELIKNTVNNFDETRKIELRDYITKKFHPKTIAQKYFDFYTCIVRS